MDVGIYEGKIIIKVTARLLAPASGCIMVPFADLDRLTEELVSEDVGELVESAVWF